MMLTSAVRLMLICAVQDEQMLTSAVQDEQMLTSAVGV
jgi:hypothetical protein